MSAGELQQGDVAGSLIFRFVTVGKVSNFFMKTSSIITFLTSLVTDIKLVVAV